MGLFRHQRMVHQLRNTQNLKGSVPDAVHMSLQVLCPPFSTQPCYDGWPLSTASMGLFVFCTLGSGWGLTSKRWRRKKRAWSLFPCSLPPCLAIGWCPSHRGKSWMAHTALTIHTHCAEGAHRGGSKLRAGAPPLLVGESAR